jgi:glycosyltransferase involved in cell wall biosynthesis
MADKNIRVLFVCHSHPAVRPGGAEGYAFDLYEEMRDSSEFDPIFLARNDRPDTGVSPRHADADIASVTDDPNQYFIYTDKSSFDWLFERSRDKSTLTESYRDFLLAVRPDVVHFQHTFPLGHDILRVTRNTLPDAPIVYTLHEFMAICHHSGQMVRTERKRHELCREASPRRCHECFPEISAQLFFARERFIRSQFALVDRFLAPSRFLMNRYIEWGLPREKMIFEQNGRRPVDRVSAPDEERPRNRFGFFGQFTPFKGADLLLKAMAILGEDFDGHLWMRGANLDQQLPKFQERFKPLLQETTRTVTVAGAYHPERIGKLMGRIDWVVLPSIWWENSPLVIQEAFLYGKPVICSNIGGMAEKVENGVSGLHFRRGSAENLAEVLKRASETPELWWQLHSGIPAVYRLDDHVARLGEIYSELLTRSRGAIGEPLSFATAPGG